VTGVAAAAGIRRVLVPRLSSVFSAFGIGFSHLAHEYQAAFDGESKLLTADLMRRARRDMYGEGVEPDACRYDVSLWSVRGADAVERPVNGALPQLPANESDPRLTVRAVYELPAIALLADATKAWQPVAAVGELDLDLDGHGATTVALIDDTALQPGVEVEGPALIRGNYLTCVVERGWRVRVSTNGDLFIEVK